MINDVAKLQNNKGIKLTRSEFEFRLRYCPIRKIIFLEKENVDFVPHNTFACENFDT
jgi:hypothetical protein